MQWSGTMVERVIYALIYICGIALCYFLIIWCWARLGCICQ
jgi:uncharacterized membrane protein YuzA (DUF378 family)